MDKKEKYKLKRKETKEAILNLTKTSFDSFRNLYWLQDLLFFLIEKDKEGLTKMSEDEYHNLFIRDRSNEDLKVSYQQAWSAKNFEIELYWKRAQYFWAFQIAAFAGYFGVLNSTNYTSDIPKHPEILFFVVCIGLITSLAWALINQGSKVWQRHWEIHVDMLEEKVTGPLYKIVTTAKTFSVSKINDLVSRFFVFIWALLSIKYFTDHLTLNPFKNNGVNWLIFTSTLVTLYFIGTMFFGYGRGRFGERQVKFYKRHFSTKDL